MWSSREVQCSEWFWWEGEGDDNTCTCCITASPHTSSVCLVSKEASKILTEDGVKYFS